MFVQSLDLTTGAGGSVDIWSITAGAGDKIILHGWEITSSATAAALVELDLKRFTTAGTGGTSSTTEENLDETDSATTATVRYGDTTGATSTGDLGYWQWEQIGPIGQVYTPEMRPVIQESQGIALELVTASAITVSGWVCWEEI